MRTEDGHIIQKCLDGDAAAFGLLVDKYKGSVYGLAYAKLGDFHDAQDMTQEVFLKAYQKLRTLKRWDKFLSWLYAITSNSCKDFLRSKASRPDGEYVTDQEKERLDKISINSHHEDKLHQTLREALSELPEIHRQVLSLHYLGGLSCREIAQFLGISPHAIAMRLSRARAKLRKEMLTMMHSSFDGQKLHSAFTLNIVEIIRRTQIQPNPQVPVIPIGIAVVSLLTLSMLYLFVSIDQFPAIGKLVGAPILSETRIAEVGEIPVDVVMLSKSSVVSSGDGKRDLERNSRQTNDVQALNTQTDVESSSLNEPMARLGNVTVREIAYSPDGSLIAIAGAIGIWFYDAESLVEVGRIAQGARYIAFSPNGRILASGHWSDRTVHLWDVKTREPVGRLVCADDWGATALTFALDGKTLAVGYAHGDANGVIGLWNIGTQQQTARLNTPARYLWALAFSPDGQLLASGGHKNAGISLWNVRSHALVATFEGHNEKPYNHEVSTVAFSPDGETLASGSAFDNTVRLWEVATGRLVAKLSKSNPNQEYQGVNSVAFNRDGTLLTSSGDDGKILLWDTQTLKQIGVLETDAGSVSSIAFRPDGKTLVSLNGGDAESARHKGGDMTLCLWNVKTHEQIAAMRHHNAEIESAALSPDGMLLASGRQDGVVALWDMRTEKLSAALGGHIATVKSVAFSSDGTLLASGEREHARLWDVHKGQLIAVFKHRAIVESVAFSPNGKILACVDDTCIRLWDTKRQKRIAVLGKQPPREITTFWDRLYARFISIEPFRDYPDPYVSTIQSVAFSPDGKLLASGGFDNKVRVWNVAKRREIFTRELDEYSDIYAVAFSPDGKTVASAGIHRKIHLWHPAERKLIGTLNTQGWCKALAFSPDGRFLAAGAEAKVGVWDMAAHAQVMTLEGCQRIVNSVTFSRDGKTLVASSEDGTIRVWDTSGLGGD